ncbi:translation initiation factor IF-2 [bacterium]|nr:translation initiation factor IF-2 [candidate division CSSED10-310 bacterium]
MRVFELAKELGVKTKDLITELNENGVPIKNHMEVLDADTIEIIRDSYKITPAETEVSLEQPEKTKESSAESKSEVVGNEILLDGKITVKEFADLMGLPGPKILGELIKMGKMLPLTEILEPDVAEQLAERLGYNLVAVEEEKVVHDVDESKLKVRPPVVTVMGHVDHGKTTLLDAIRATQVAEREAGGITQHIGASWVDLPEGRIVFLDTPGHEAFTKLRARGAQVTDIVILIVAADDGVMPQTIEAINHAREAAVPIIVAINKIDKANADVDKVKKDLVSHNLVPEEWGGQTQIVSISAKKKEGIKALLEMILFQAEVMDLKTIYDAPAKGIVIESRLDKGKGPMASILIKEGTLHVSDSVITGLHYGKVRAMLDWQGRQIQLAKPSTPVEILGLSGVPKAGDLIEVVENDKIAKDEALRRQQEQQEKILAKRTKITFDELFSQIQTGSVKELKVVVKVDVQGSLEAIEESLEKLGAGSVKIKIIHSGIGAITDNDVMLASASNAVVIGFNVRPNNSTRNLADREHIEIRLYRVIYDLINDIKDAMEGLLEPEIEEVIVGQAEIREIFSVPKVGTVAGCFVITGKIVRSNSIRLIRDSVVVWEGKIQTLKRFKDDAKEVQQGFECGISLEGYQDLKIGDIIENYTLQAVT